MVVVVGGPQRTGMALATDRMLRQKRESVCESWFKEGTEDLMLLLGILQQL